MAALSLRQRQAIAQAYRTFKVINGLNAEQGEQMLFDILFTLDPPPPETLTRARGWITGAKANLVDQQAAKDIDKTNLQRTYDDLVAQEATLP